MQGPVFLGAQPVIHASRVPFGPGKEGFFPRPPHLYRSPSGMKSSQTEQALHGDAVFASERSTCIRRDYSDTAHIHSERFGNFHTVTERGLCGTDYFQLSILFDSGPTRLSLQIRVLLALSFEAVFQNHIAFFFCGRACAGFQVAFQQHIAIHVVFVHERSTILKGRLCIKDAGQGLNITSDQLDRIFQSLSVFSENKGNRISAMADLIVNEDRLILSDNSLSVSSRNILWVRTQMTPRRSLACCAFMFFKSP